MRIPTLARVTLPENYENSHPHPGLRYLKTMRVPTQNQGLMYLKTMRITTLARVTIPENYENSPLDMVTLPETMRIPALAWVTLLENHENSRPGPGYVT